MTEELWPFVTHTLLRACYVLTTLPDNKEQEKTNLSAPGTNAVVRENKKGIVVRVGTPGRLGEGHMKGTQFLVRL